jgi:UPF0176 protein
VSYVFAFPARLRYNRAMMSETQANAPYRVVAFYRFVEVKDPAAVQAHLKSLVPTYDLSGTILIAPEGLNGTIASSDAGIDVVIDYLDANFGLRQGQVKYSDAQKKPFLRFKPRIKKEIITMRRPEADPTKKVGTYVTPQDWDALLADPEVTLIDTRNIYETKIGIFKNAIDPQINVFTELPDFVEKNLDPKKNKKIAMFCTGGIRCEKASSYMLAQGFEEVYHLQGGILKYLEEIPADKSSWEGECFVFDGRVGIKHGLEEGSASTCYACREPLFAEDRESPLYEEGVSCPHCHGTFDEKTIAAKRMRHQHKLNFRKQVTSRA